MLLRMRPTPVHHHTPGPGVIQLEDDSSAPLMAPEHMLALALTAKGEAEARAENAEILAGHFCLVVCSLIQMLMDNPETAHMVDKDGMVVIPAELWKRVDGMQVEGVHVGEDIGIVRRERASELLVVGRGF